MTSKNQKLHRRHATVHTASIDVKIMRLDGKQMTLSMFRQLPEASIFDPDWVRYDAGPDKPLRLVGVPWGIVRYVWEKSPVWADYYVVWSDGSTIYRMPVPLTSNMWRPCLLDVKTVWGCRYCDGLTWSHTSLGLEDYDPDRERCSECGRKCTYIKQNHTVKKVLGFATWAIRDWCPWNKWEPKNPACIMITKHMEVFEQLDQLFIAI